MRSSRFFNRREMLKLSGAAAASLAAPFAYAPAAAQGAWSPGDVVHIIPTASHDRFLIKVSLTTALERPPALRLRDRRFQGIKTDDDGRCWMFYATRLTAATGYDLQLVASDNKPLCDPWPLKTFPAPNTRPEQFRILAYTCAGGYDGPPLAGKTFWLEMAARRKLLDRGLSFEPDAIIANGDHISWDQETTLNKPKAVADHIVQHWWGKFGQFDRTRPMFGTKNESVLKAVADYQIAGLYGARLRSIPAFFLTDDHDQFESGEFSDDVATMPAQDFGLDGEDATQFMYYPEFMYDPTRPDHLPGTRKAGRVPGANQFFGTLRYGNLFEAVFYDCRRFADYKGAQGRLIPDWTEDWLIKRTLARDTLHFAHVPSVPFGYTTGKLGEWYPDSVGEQGRMVLFRSKPGWQPGWFAQHQRLMEALGKQQQRSAVVVQGDVPASAAGKITRVGGLNLSGNPVHVVLTGTLGTGDYGFPSAARSVASAPSGLVVMEETIRPTERNGFTIIDVTPDKMTFRLFMWRPPQPVAAIDNLQPALTYEVSRPS